MFKAGGRGHIVSNMNRNTIDRKSETFLNALIEEQEPTFEPDETSEWADAFLNSIRNFRDSQRGKEVERAAERLGIQAYAEPYRFFWEFWQNADDAEATKIDFIINPDCLIITNNGNPFSAREIFSLIFVASTTKASRTDLMGQFGIGSLALMRLSKSPSYYSGYYSFKLERSYTYPATIKDKKNRYFPGTKVIAPLGPDIDAQELYEALADKMENETLLYMKNLKQVRIRNSLNNQEKKAVIHFGPCGGGEYVFVGRQRWLRFVCDVIPPPKTRRIDGTEVVGPVRITLVRHRRPEHQHPVCAYFPTLQSHHYPWRFSAPFDVPTGRGALIECSFNRWLLQETGRAMVHASIVDGVGMPSQPWKLVPLSAHPDSLINEVWEGACEEMKSVAWLPSEAGFVKPKFAAFPETPIIRQLIQTSDLLTLKEKQRNWLSVIPSVEARPVLQSLGTLRVCCHVLSRLLARGPRNKNAQWYMKTLATVIELAKDLGDEEIYGRLIEGRCILNYKGRPISLAKAHKAGQMVYNTRSEALAKQLGELFPSRFILLLNKIYRLRELKKPELDDELKRGIDVWLRETSSDVTFQYISRLDAAAFIKRFVIDKSDVWQPGEITDRVLDFVRDHVESYVSDQGAHRRRQILLELGEHLRIKAHSILSGGKRITDYRLVSEVYLPAGFLDKASWSHTARDIPNLWWADWQYRRRLARSSNPIGVVGFLRELGAATGPKIEIVPSNSWHGMHKFTRVTHGDPQRFPNYPHKEVPFGRYSEYGLIGDSRSPDLLAWWEEISKLTIQSRSQKGEQLLRALEDGWDFYHNFAQARATAYYSNAEYELGNVPSQWVWFLQNWTWVMADDGSFIRPGDVFARTETNIGLLYPERKELLCRWSPKSIEALKALGFRTDVPASNIISYLREAKSSDRQLPTIKAAIYYAQLSKEAESQEVVGAMTQGLIYSPNSRQNWWKPQECIETDQHSIFGTYCGYLNLYTESKSLWEALGIVKIADLGFLRRFWNRVGNSEEPSDALLQAVLGSTYQLAEDLLSTTKQQGTTIPVIADGEWHNSNEVFSTTSDEISQYLREKGLYRWDYGYPDLVPNFQEWINIFHVERNAKFKPILLGNEISSELEEQLHAGIQSFAAEVSRVSGEIWSKIRQRLSALILGRLYVTEPLRVRIIMNHKKTGDINFEVTMPVLYLDGNLYISYLTKLQDRTVALAILSGLPITGESRWAAVSNLQIHLSSPQGRDLPLTPFDEEPVSEPTGEFWDESLSGPESTKEKPTTRTKEPKSTPIKPIVISSPPYPVDEYEKVSDEVGKEAITVTGGLIPRRKVHLKKPTKIKRPKGHEARLPRHQPLSTEQRAVELIRIYLFEPDGIDILDQRLRPGVGADIVGSDQVFREVKARSESCEDDLELTEREYIRAGMERSKYELIIVEHIWDDPVFTIIPDPLGKLNYYPTGGVMIQGWRNLAPKPRVIHLQRRGTAQRKKKP